MRHAERVHAHIAHLEARAGAENAAVEFGFQLALDSFLREAVAINGDVQSRGEHGETLDVIRMFVRDEDAAQAFRRASDGEEAVADLPSAQAGVDEQARLAGFQKGAIAAGTAAEKGEMGGHERTLGRAGGAGNVFDVRREKIMFKPL